jgi:ABC-type multidrug transport system fused ATPase/permease subunit
MYIFKILIDYFKDYKLYIFIYILFTILSFPMESILIPHIYGKFFDILDKNTDKSVYIKYIGLIVFIQIIVNISDNITSYINSIFIPNLNHYIINYIFKNLLRKYENSITEIELGKITTRLSTIPAYIKEFITDFFVWIFPRFFTILLINFYFFYINFSIGLVSTLLLCIFFYINMTYFYSCSKISLDRHHLFEKNNQYTQDLLSNSSSIYAAGNTINEIKNYDLKTKKYTSKFKENLLCINKVNFISGILIVVLFALLNILTVFLYYKKKITYTNLISILIMIIYYIPCITTIGAILPTITHTYGPILSVDEFIQDLYNVENSYDDIKNKQINNDRNNINNNDSNNRNNNDINNRNNNNIKYIKLGNIIINNLSFGYNENNLIFKNFYLTIKNNEKIAIIGNSGNGKSTLIKIIMGYYKVPNNTIYLDGIDINNYDITELRKEISYVNQNTKLFNVSILENIQYGNNMSREDIELLIKKINIQNIFSNLKDGLDSPSGIEGSKLSGGQKQVIHILRCLGKNNKIVILDEPTSAIDIDNKDNIIKTIKELSKNKTLILITHDPKLLSLVNRIIKIESGKIIEDNYI